MSDDPHYQREKEKYENPVASREYLMSLLKEHDKPLSFLDICNLVNAFDEEARIGIQRRLRAMEREGQVQTVMNSLKAELLVTVMATAFCVLKTKAVIYLSVLGK